MIHNLAAFPNCWSCGISVCIQNERQVEREWQSKGRRRKMKEGKECSPTHGNAQKDRTPIYTQALEHIHISSLWQHTILSHFSIINLNLCLCLCMLSSKSHSVRKITSLNTHTHTLTSTHTNVPFADMCWISFFTTTSLTLSFWLLEVNCSVRMYKSFHVNHDILLVSLLICHIRSASN